jgi:hypothetical protein
MPQSFRGGMRADDLRGVHDPADDVPSFRAAPVPQLQRACAVAVPLRRLDVVNQIQRIEKRRGTGIGR